MQPALWSVKTTTWGAYFTGTKQTQQIYPVKCETYFTGTRETKQTNDVPAEGSLACRSFSAKAALPAPHGGINFQSWVSTLFHPKDK
jgi:hypothetical protein